MKTIFTQIASYRDPQLIPTLDSLLDNADKPENIHIGICWQHADDETLDIFLDAGVDVEGYSSGNPTVAHDMIHATYKGAKLTIIDVPYLEAQGACWARNSIQQLYNNETYTLQLDSHHRFVPSWDTKCIGMLEGLRYKSPKPVLTAYIPSYDPNNDPQGRVNEAWKMEFDRFIPEGAVFFLPSSIKDRDTRTEPMRARFYSGHFCFADGSFSVEVQHDPEYFFHGEEISIAARAFTHGYDLYHPHIIVAWHEYTRAGRTKVWDDHTTETKQKKGLKLDWVERNNLCHNRNRILFGMDGEDPSQIDFGKYGFGSERTLRDYEEYAGISFKYRAVQQNTLNHVEPVWPLERAYESEQDWRASLVGSHDIRICVHRNALGEIVDDFDFWYVAAHDGAEGDPDTEIYRKDLLPDDIAKHLKGDWVDYRFIFLADRKPTRYVIWTHSKSRGWLTRFVQQL